MKLRSYADGLFYPYYNLYVTSVHLGVFQVPSCQPITFLEDSIMAYQRPESLQPSEEAHSHYSILACGDLMAESQSCGCDRFFALTVCSPKYLKRSSSRAKGTPMEL